MWQKFLGIIIKEPREIPLFLDSYYEALQLGDDKRIEAFLCDNCMMQIGSDKMLEGRDSILNYLGNIRHLILNIEFDFIKTLRTNDVIIKEGFAYYTFRSGVISTVPVCHILKTKKDQVYWHYIYRSALQSVESI